MRNSKKFNVVIIGEGSYMSNASKEEIIEEFSEEVGESFLPRWAATLGYLLDHGYRVSGCTN